MNISVKLTLERNYKYYKVQKDTIINIEFETYLKGVVSQEIGNSPIEAAKAQAVAARTYAWPYLKNGNVIVDNSNAQAYNANRAVDSAYVNAHNGVNETKGMLITYKGKVIDSCVYSASNGGETVSAQKQWGGTGREWLITKNDPWDKNSGKPKNGHGVGMSQEGAKYAATQGIDYLEILAFYYDGTQVVDNYGSGNIVSNSLPNGGSEIMTKKTNIGLVEWCKNLLGNPYWYGTCCYKCTQSVLTSKTKQYPSHYTESRMPRYKDDIAKGKTAADCVGLIKGFIWANDQGEVKYQSATDKSAGGMYSACIIKGPIHTIPEVPGICVYKPGHIGVYEGNGIVIEAKGFASGIIRSKLNDTAWENWGAIPYITYSGYEHLLQRQFTGPFDGIVNTKSSPLNIWDSPNKVRSLAQLSKGTTISVIDYWSNNIGWYKVQKGNIIGAVDSQYILEPEIPNILDDEDDEDSEIPIILPSNTVLYRAKTHGLNSGLNLRAVPSLVSTTLTYIPNDTYVDVYEDLGQFLKIKYNNIIGYATSSYFIKEENSISPIQLYNISITGIPIDIINKIIQIWPTIEIKKQED